MLRYWSNLQVNFGYFFDAFIAFAPLLIFGSIVAAIISIWLGKGNERVEIFFQMLFTALIGCVVAYIQLAVGDIIGQILPPSLVILTVLFQLIGRIKPDLNVPMDSPRTFAAAGMAIGSFLLSAQYISKAISFD